MSDEHVLHSDTRSTPRGDGVRDLHVSERWNTLLGHPNGGYLLATMLRGLREEIGAGEPVSASISYLSPPAPGPAELRTDVLRRGRVLSTATASLHEGDRLVAHLVASFGDRTTRRAKELGSPPHLPPPERCIDPTTRGMVAEGLFARAEYRLPVVSDWSAGERSGDGVIRLWQRLEGGQEVDWTGLAFMTDSFAPAVLQIAGVVTTTTQLTAYFYRLPAPGWIATVLTTRHMVDGFHEEDCELWDSAGNLVAQSRQLLMVLG
ncbi:MAG: thioesterase family protein [Aeromicrobium sp.]